MKRCSHCERSLESWRLRCQVCRSYNWRLPHIVFSAILCLAVLGGGILALDHLIYSKQETTVPPSQTKPSQGVYRPQRSIQLSDAAPASGARRQ